MMKILYILITGIFAYLISCQPASKSERYDTIFTDSFDTASQGAYKENVIQLPPPEGLGFTWKVLEGGYLPVSWTLSDEVQSDNPKKGFWVIPPDSGYMEQGGRSHNSVLFAKTPIPESAKYFTISFKQYRGDNDPITYVLGADEPHWKKGIEIGYMTQVPGTDSTTIDAYVIGDLGEFVVEGMALGHEWVDHKIDVNLDTISWKANDQLMVKGIVEQPLYGYFGIRHRYERGTRYDDVRIMIRE